MQILQFNYSCDSGGSGESGGSGDSGDSVKLVNQNQKEKVHRMKLINFYPNVHLMTVAK